MTRLKVIVSNYLLKHLLNAITEDQILIHNGKKFTIGGKELPEADYRDIVTGAQAIKSMYVWQLLCKDMKNEANKAIFTKSSVIDDIIFGKAMLLALDIMEKKLDKLSKL